MGLVIAWFFVLRTIWRADLFERFLGLDKAPLQTSEERVFSEDTEPEARSARKEKSG